MVENVSHRKVDVAWCMLFVSRLQEECQRPRVICTSGARQTHDCFGWSEVCLQLAMDQSEQPRNRQVGNVWIVSVHLDSETQSMVDSLTELGVDIGVTLPRHCDLAVVYVRDKSEDACVLIRRARDEGCDRVLVVAKYRASASDAWRYLDAGASDVISGECNALVAQHIHNRLARWKMTDDCVRRMTQAHGLIGDSSVWKTMRREVLEGALFKKLPILIMGRAAPGRNS